MASNNFDRSLALTLKWEGGYSNNSSDPGGATDHGVTWREYNTWRRKQGLSVQSVRLITPDEVKAIYKANYWDAVNGDALAAGVDYAVFDLAVNNGVGRAKQLLARALKSTDGSPVAVINAVCAERMAFDKGLGHLWRVFGPGWSRRINGVDAQALEQCRTDAHGMAANAPAPKDRALRLGSAGPLVAEMQKALRAHGYPVGAIDGIFGRNTQRAVILFQADINSAGERGAWIADYSAKLAAMPPHNAARLATTESDLHRQGDPVIAVQRLLKAFLAWSMLFLSIGQGTVSSKQVADAVASAQDALGPLMDILAFVEAHKYAVGLAVCFALFAAVHWLSWKRLREYTHFDFQGAFQKGDK